MTLTPVDMRMIRDQAITNFIDKGRHIDETEDAFVSRCWFEAFKAIVGKDEYEIGIIHKSTGAATLVSIPEYRK